MDVTLAHRIRPCRPTPGHEDCFDSGKWRALNTHVMDVASPTFFTSSFPDSLPFLRWPSSPAGDMTCSYGYRLLCLLSVLYDPPPARLLLLPPLALLPPPRTPLGTLQARIRLFSRTTSPSPAGSPPPHRGHDSVLPYLDTILLHDCSSAADTAQFFLARIRPSSPAADMTRLDTSSTPFTPSGCTLSSSCASPPSSAGPRPPPQISPTLVSLAPHLLPNGITIVSPSTTTCITSVPPSLYHHQFRTFYS
ncbi:hypothetical protein B0H17DRAFT_1208896 [Mycena rosella]|uniref:Uncharacterized protein n=1 Tax=Mycena rosella TaxID=1033263 RepID=A0AAD7CZR4_MYCRO|nr:hypothetical protein B0H17DRAFT_1208896 [Mycena rosella]